MSALARAALEYARRGWPVFPVRPAGKDPLVPGGFKAATTDAGQVAAWWTEDPDANIGCPPGGAGAVVFDWDTREGQHEAHRLGLYSEPTLVVETARGHHIYFQHPGFHVGNRKINGVIDVRADAGYVLLPPSIHSTGVVYRAHGKLEEIRPLPEHVVELLRKPERPRPPSVDNGPPPIEAGTPRRQRYVAAAIEAELHAVVTAREGNRNNRLNEAAFSLARFVATGEADPAMVADALAFAAHHAGLDDDEIAKTIRSAFAAREVAV